MMLMRNDVNFPKPRRSYHITNRYVSPSKQGPRGPLDKISQAKLEARFRKGTRLQGATTVGLMYPNLPVSWNSLNSDMALRTA